MNEQQVKLIISAVAASVIIVLMIGIVLWDMWAQAHGITYKHDWVTITLIVPGISAMIYSIFRKA